MVHRPLLVSSDFKRHVAALELLSTRLGPDWEALGACLDLILQWVAARICEANTSCLLRALGFLQALFSHMQAQVGGGVAGPGGGRICFAGKGRWGVGLGCEGRRMQLDKYDGDHIVMTTLQE